MMGDQEVVPVLCPAGGFPALALAAETELFVPPYLVFLRTAGVFGTAVEAARTGRVSWYRLGTALARARRGQVPRKAPGPSCHPHFIAKTITTTTKETNRY